MDKPFPGPPAARSQAITEAVRVFLETVWPGWHVEGQRVADAAPVTPSTGVCARSSVFLQRVLVDRGIVGVVCFGWFIVDPSNHGSDRLRHAWVEADDLVLDVTADQFGHPPVIVTHKDDPRYIRDVDVADEKSRTNRVQTAEILWPFWIRNPKNLALDRPA